VIPYERRYALIGTTDLDYEGDPAAVRITVDEVDYLCKLVSRYFKRPLRSEQVEWTYSGVRPLYDDARGDVSTVTRDYAFDLDPGGEGEPPLLSVYGGKITTYRRLAEHALAKLQPVMGFAGGAWTRDARLPGGDMPNADFDAFLTALLMSRSWLPPALAQRYARAYGTRLERVLGTARSLRDLGEPMGEGLYEAEVDYLVQNEWALTADDILWRRTKLGLHLGEEAELRLRAWLVRNYRLAAALAG
jgi:glycerol-3-phosphate dehydrogenase